jgi:hypothetical protein
VDDFSLAFRLLARAEIAEAQDWYEARRSGLGDQFVTSLNRTFELIERNPFQYQVARGRLRRAPNPSVSYNLIYTIRDKEVIVLGCVHKHHDP